MLSYHRKLYVQNTLINRGGSLSLHLDVFCHIRHVIQTPNPYENTVLFDDEEIPNTFFVNYLHVYGKLIGNFIILSSDKTIAEQIFGQMTSSLNDGDKHCIIRPLVEVNKNELLETLHGMEKNKGSVNVINIIEN